MYKELIAKHQAFSAEDFRRIGKWKDNADSPGKWKANIASVAYLIWEQAAAELPKCPANGEVLGFLDGWAGRTYDDVFANGTRTKVFGIPRATTLLHFLSGARFPIYDSRVRTAVSRLLGKPRLPNTVEAYLNRYVPLFGELAESCETRYELTLDKALLSFGALKQEHFKGLSPGAGNATPVQDAN